MSRLSGSFSSGDDFPGQKSSTIHPNCLLLGETKSEHSGRRPAHILHLVQIGSRLVLHRVCPGCAWFVKFDALHVIQIWEIALKLPFRGNQAIFGTRGPGFESPCPDEKGQFLVLGRTTVRVFSVGCPRIGQLEAVFASCEIALGQEPIGPGDLPHKECGISRSWILPWAGVQKEELRNRIVGLDEKRCF